MAESAQKILHEVTQAGLISADQITKFDRIVETGVEPLLEKLLAEGHITEYQADKFRQGLTADIAFGDYVVMDKLGQGGMGTVLLARHKRMEREVAIKVLPVTALESEAAVARFYQEVKVAAKLTHPNIVHAYDAGEHHGFHYLVMEYVSGHDLAQVIHRLGPIPATLAVDYILQAVQGLDYAHRKGIVHRDIKPSNLLLDDEGNIKILDMGLARLGGQTIGDSNVSMHLTTTGQVMGTVEYMSPEQAEDTRLADARSDIYSLGCTLYRLITARSPFARDTVVKTILAHRESPIPTLVDDVKGILDDAAAFEVDRIFKRTVAKRPADRYQSTGELMEDLRRFVDGDQSQFGGSQLNLDSFKAPEPPPEIVPGKDKSSETFHSPFEPTLPPSSRERFEITEESTAYQDDPTYKGPAYTPFTTPGTDPGVAPVEQTPSPSEDSNVIPRYGSAIPKGFVAPVTRGNAFAKKHRGMKLLIMSVCSLLCSFCIIGGVIGIVTWVYANSDLEEMKKGFRDPRGRELTQSSKVIGIISVVIAGMSILGGTISTIFN